MDTYFDHLNQNILGAIILKLDFHEFNNLHELIGLDDKDINYNYLTTVRFADYMNEIKQEYSMINFREYRIILCALIIRDKLKLKGTLEAVSYTHLTLPTTPYV